MNKYKRDKLSMAYTHLHSLECLAKNLEKKLTQVRRQIHLKKKAITKFRDSYYNN